MRKIMNSPASFVDDFLDGMLAAHPGHFLALEHAPRAIVRADADARSPQVGILTGGGSGHLPVFVGYVGRGLLSGAAIGNTFSSPSAETIHAATRAVERGRGVLYLYGNYGGDNLNFDDAADLAEEDGISTATVRVAEDVASAPAEFATRRRGVAGMTIAFKCAGAAAAEGRSLAEVADVARRCLAATRTMGVGLSPTILPEAGAPTFEIGDGEMELGIGIHGEPGILRAPLGTADEIADSIIERLTADLGQVAGKRLAVMVNSLGATPLEELYIVFGRLARQLKSAGATVQRTLIGRYATSLEMAGCSVTLTVVDDELVRYLDADCYSPLLRLL